MLKVIESTKTQNINIKASFKNNSYAIKYGHKCILKHQVVLQAAVREGVECEERGSHCRLWPKRIAGGEWTALKAVPSRTKTKKKMRQCIGNMKVAPATGRNGGKKNQRWQNSRFLQ